MPKFTTLSNDEKSAVIAFLWDEGQDILIDTEKIKLSFFRKCPAFLQGIEH